MGLSTVVMAVAAATGAQVRWPHPWQHVSGLEQCRTRRQQIGGPMTLATMTASALGVWILFSPPKADSAFYGITTLLSDCLGSAVAVLLLAFVSLLVFLRSQLGVGEGIPRFHSLNDCVRHRFVPQQNFLGGPMYGLASKVHAAAYVSLPCGQTNSDRKPSPTTNFRPPSKILSSFNYIAD